MIGAAFLIALLFLDRNFPLRTRESHFLRHIKINLGFSVVDFASASLGIGPPGTFMVGSTSEKSLGRSRTMVDMVEAALTGKPPDRDSGRIVGQPIFHENGCKQ